MKDFLRSTAGKTVLFILCIITTCTLIVSVIGAAVMFQEDAYFYTHTEEEIKQDFIGSELKERGYGFVYDAIDDSSVFYDNGAITYEVLDSSGNRIGKSKGAGTVSDWQYSFKYGIWRSGDNEITSVFYINEGYYDPEEYGEDYCIVRMNVNEESGISDREVFVSKIIHIAYSLRYAVYAVALVSLIMSVVFFIALMSVSGHRPHTEEVFPGLLDRIPFDILAGALCIFFAVGVIHVTENLWVDTDLFAAAVLAVFSFAGLNILLGLCMSAASRIKLGTLFTNTVIYRLFVLIIDVLKYCLNLMRRIFTFLSTVFRGIPLVWKTLLIMLGITFFEAWVILGFACNEEALLALLFLEKLILIPAVMYFSICLRRLEKGGEALANGKLSHITDTRGLFGDLKKHACNLNSIADGMAIAVEERLKSERMKTELITNVSHDIKTPLTSIINYSTLIGREECGNEKITEYSEVLVRQSERLRRLLEDLVEASKASTGNLDVNLTPCDAAVFISQAAGEYSEKLENAGLKLITKQPDREVRIMADGRRMWRVFDNLMNNICKYALPGTRVYLSLEQADNTAVFTFKNTSGEPLDMTEEELMERFTRGDSSRNTEGNGLGLSIAKSMAELQGGSLKLTIDGDLFKAILSFPVV